jgi:O-antigen/teichoic acid export membrane protein
MLVAVARLGTQELVGRYALGLAIASPIFLLFSLQLRTILAASTYDGDVFGIYFAFRLISSAIALVATAVVASQVSSSNAAWVVFVVGLSKAIDALHDVLYGLFWRHDRMDYIAVSMLIRGATAFAAFAVTFYVTGSLSSALLVVCASWLVVLALYDARMACRLVVAGSPWWKPHWSAETAKQLFWMGMPAGILSWLTSLQVNVPRYFVQHVMGEAALGVLSAQAFLLIGLEMGARSFNYAAMPRMARFIQLRDMDRLRHLLERLTMLGLALATGVVAAALVAGRRLISLLLGPAYADYSWLFVILSLGFAVRTATMPTAMTLRAINAYSSMIVVQILSILTLFASCVVFVPMYGLEGSALASLISFGVDGAGRLYLHRVLVAGSRSDLYPERGMLQRA